eukprot:UN10311
MAMYLKFLGYLMKCLKRTDKRRYFDQMLVQYVFFSWMQSKIVRDGKIQRILPLCSPKQIQ